MTEKNIMKRNSEKKKRAFLSLHLQMGLIGQRVSPKMCPLSSTKGNDGDK